MASYQCCIDHKKKEVAPAKCITTLSSNLCDIIRKQ
jgi:hypothetical protein